MAENRMVPRRRGAVPTARSPFEGFFGANAFGSLQEEINRLFDDVWGTAPAATEAAPATATAMRPRVDLAESEEAYEISAEMPGLKEDEIEVNVTDDVLSVKGEHKSEAEKKDERYHVRERSYGSFQRSFRLPANADADGVSARFENGVLSVTVPKLAEAKAQSRKIAVEKA